LIKSSCKNSLIRGVLTRTNKEIRAGQPGKQDKRKKVNIMAELNEKDLDNVVGGAGTNNNNIPDTYTVVSGDCLSTIAAKFHTTWQKLYELNKEMIERDARAHGVKEHFENYIYPGQVLKLK
jgi:LysM repeat protein